MKAQKNKVVRLAYRITEAQSGRLIEERDPDNSYEYIHGSGQIVGPVERAVEGKTSGFRAEVAVSPREGYGAYDPSLIAEMPRASFPDAAKVAVGQRFNTLGPQGNPVTVRVIEVDEDVVTVDGNHPLAGLDLIFELRLLEVRDATREEIETGRIGAPPRAAGDDDPEFGGSIH